MCYCARMWLSVVVAVAIAGSAWPSEIGAEIVAQPRVESYRYILDSQLFTHLSISSQKTDTNPSEIEGLSR